MENATKAMMIAAGVLIGVMILSLGAVLYADLDAYVQNTQNEIQFNEINSFNTRYLSYVNYYGIEKKFDLTIQDVVTVANMAYENNYSYNPNSNVWTDSADNLYVAVYLNGRRIDQTIQDTSADLLKNNLNMRYVLRNTDIIFNQNSGKICRINFFDE